MPNKSPKLFLENFQINPPKNCCLIAQKIHLIITFVGNERSTRGRYRLLDVYYLRKITP